MDLAPLPTTMKLAHPWQPGGPDVLALGERALPVAGPGEVLIRVAAAGVNRADCLQRMGNYPVPAGATDILGLECAGTVVAVGEGVSDQWSGAPVAALLVGGGYAQYVAVPAAQCLPVPAGLSMEAAASLMETCCTVWSNVHLRAAIQPGETLLVHGGSSGIGVTAIQIFAALGHRVFATAGSEAKCVACVELGAERAIDYRTEDFVAVALQLTEGRGVDVVLDMVGGDYVPRSLKALADDGRLVGIAASSGRQASIDLLDLYRRRQTITGSALRRQSLEAKAAIVESVRRHVWPLIEAGTVRPVIFRTFPLEEAAAAHALMESSQHIGKLVLRIG
jgi:NADPH:quinone reductase